MKEIFLDTSAYSAFKRGTQKVMEKIREADQLYLNAIVIGELLSGFSRGKFKESNRQELKEFLTLQFNLVVLFLKLIFSLIYLIFLLTMMEMSKQVMNLFLEVISPKKVCIYGVICLMHLQLVNQLQRKYMSILVQQQ